MPTEAQPTPAPTTETPKTDPPIRISAGGVEVVAKGAQAIYAVALLACFFFGGKILPPAYEAVNKLTDAMNASASALAKVSADVAEARAATESVRDGQRKMEQRFDERFGDLERDLRSLREDIRASRK